MIPVNLTLAQQAALPVQSVANQKLQMVSVINWFGNNRFSDPCKTNDSSFVVSVYQKLIIQANLGRITHFEAHADSILLSNLLRADEIAPMQELIIAFENEILESNLSAEVKQRQLIFSAILRNSLKYWMDVLDNPSHRCHTYMGDFLNNCPNADSQRGRWKKVLKAMCAGFCDAVGGALGAGIGGMIGPTGAAIGAGILGPGSSAFAASFFD